MAVEETKRAASALTDKAGTIAKWGLGAACAASAYLLGPTIAFQKAGVLVGETAEVIGTGLAKGGAYMATALKPAAAPV